MQPLAKYAGQLRRFFESGASCTSSTSASTGRPRCSSRSTPSARSSSACGSPRSGSTCLTLSCGGSLTFAARNNHSTTPRYSRSDAEIEIMRSLKRVMDPLGLLNPGKVL